MTRFFVFALAVSITAPLAAQSILVDVGAPGDAFNDGNGGNHTLQAGNWNHLIIDNVPGCCGQGVFPAQISGLINSNGAAIPSVINVTVNNSGETGLENFTVPGANLISPSGLAHPEDATKDGIFLGGGAAVLMEITDLAGDAYNVHLFGRSTQGGWNTTFDVNSLGPQSLATTNNVEFVTFANVAPINGSIFINVTNTGPEGAFNSFEIEQIGSTAAIPEPSTLAAFALVSLVGLGYGACRARRRR